MSATTNDDPLFAPLTAGAFELPNRIVLAPLTRSRAGQPGNVPGQLNADYYVQRAGAGLILSEATNISQIGTGYALTPGIFTDEQVAGWRLVTDAVHAAGGRMLLQLWHCGRMSHESLHPGEAPRAPSALPCDSCQVFTVDAEGRGGRTPVSPPQEMTAAEIKSTIDDYAQAARRAMRAGFDGVQVHSANGYLLHQFLASNTNHRTDGYGGSLSNRCRLLFEVMDAVLAEVPAGQVSVRLSPLFNLNGMADADPAETFGHVTDHLSRLSIALLEIADTDVMAGAEPRMESMLAFTRARFDGILMLNGGYTPERARAALAAGDGDCISFGRLFLANPDLPERIRRNGPYNEPNPDTFYGGGAEGYTDYPSLDR
ncbi:alkene reductase [Rhabdochromatium marinum]|uniref:alkene reductase n=1 Tax=Rhabdochromatium marinum TaxID=48729 RepID=UPI0019048717|nr:alkene reductase [Rhabdochromatium marinum]MBK1647220.1 alkene reductase [Rhabdochromatium marinum]